MKPMTHASRIRSWLSFGSARTMANKAFCILGDGSTMSNIGGTDKSSSPPGSNDVRISNSAQEHVVSVVESIEKAK